MSESNQNEILLSAYLDGELSADELKKVQDLIARDAHARFLLQQWKDQRDALKSLPPVRLPRDLTAGILSRLNSPGTIEKRTNLGREALPFKEENGPTKPFNWRMVYTIASSMAAMLLLSIFLYPGRDSGQTERVAENKNSSEKSSEVKTPEASIEAVKTAVPSPSAEVPSAPSNSQPSISIEPSSPQHAETDSDSAMGDEMASNIKPFGSEGFGGLSDSAETEMAMAAPAAKADKPAALSEDQSGSEIGSDIVSEKAAVDGPATVQTLDESVTSDQIAGVNQVFLLEIRDAKTAPIALVADILGKNDISILNGGLPADGSMEDSSGSRGAETLNKLYERSPEGMEALFVFASRTQLQSAMQVLREQADITACDVKMNQDESSRLAADEGVSEDDSNENEPTMDQRIEIVAREMKKLRDENTADLNRAMAQKIPSPNNLPRSSSKSESKSKRFSPKKGAVPDPPKERFFIEYDKVYFDLKAVEGITRENESGEKRVPFLLFVRNRPAN